MPSALTLVRFGQYPLASPDDGYTSTVAGTLRMTHEGMPTANFWSTDLGFWGGEAVAGSSPTVWMGAYEAGSPTVGGTPTTLIDRWAAGFSVGADYESASDTGARNEHAGALNGQFWGNKIYAVGPLALTNGLGIAVNTATIVAFGNLTAYNKSGISALPDPFTPSSSTASFGRLYAYVLGWENEPPLVPASRAPTGTVYDLTPTFTGSFRDLNGSYGTANNGLDQGDIGNRVRIQVRRVSDAVSFWSYEGAFTGSEQTADAFTKTYAGTTLIRGTPYEWRTQVSDQFGEWGDYSTWLTFTPADAGIVNTDGLAPNTKLEVNTGITFNAKWHHVTALAMTHAKIQIIDVATFAVLQQSGEIAKAVASSASPGTAFTISWAESGFTDLAWGKLYIYRISGKDSGGNWSNYYGSLTPPLSFSTDFAPTVPASLTPSGSQVFTSFPLLTAVWTDGDDTTGTGLTGTFEITRPDLGTVSVTPTYNATTLRWEFQTTGTELDEFGIFTFRARSFDGTLYSGETTVIGDAVWSSPATFIYHDGPDIVNVIPVDAATVTTASLFVQWTTVDQQQFQVILYHTGTTIIEADSGVVVGTTSAWMFTSGTYRNGYIYDLYIWVADSLDTEGSGTITITVDIDPADALLNVQGSLHSHPLDPVDTSVLITWDQTIYPEVDAGDGRFSKYIIYRSADGGPDAARVRVFESSTPTTLQYIDTRPASGYEYTYEVYQVITTGVDEILSVPVEILLTITLGQFHVLTSVVNGETYRAVLTNVTEKSFGLEDGSVAYQSPNGGLPVTFSNGSQVQTVAFTAAMIGDSFATAMERKAAFEELVGLQQTVCFRDGRGHKKFYRVIGPNMTARIGDTGGVWYQVAGALRQESLQEGQT